MIFHLHTERGGGTLVLHANFRTEWIKSFTVFLLSWLKQQQQWVSGLVWIKLCHQNKIKFKLRIIFNYSGFRWSVHSKVQVQDIVQIYWMCMYYVLLSMTSTTMHCYACLTYTWTISFVYIIFISTGDFYLIFPVSRTEELPLILGSMIS